MKKIAIFTQNLDIGGVQKSVTTVANFLSSKYEIIIILGEDNKNISYRLNDNIKSIQCIKYIKIDINEIGIAKKLMNYRVKELELLLNNINPDLLFSFGEYNNIIALKTSYKCKKLISIRAVFESMKAKKIHLLTYLEYEELMIKYYPLADSIISVSNYIEKELKDLIPNIKTKVISNGININNLNTTCIKNPPIEKYILNIGRLHPQKGQLDLIKAFARISTKIEHNLIIIGDGDYKVILQNEIDKLKMNKRIHLLGSIQTPYVFMKQCDLFIFPSYYEGFPNVLIEAMACNTAVISYKFQGYDEILEENNNLCEIGDVNELAKKILFFINNVKDKNNLSRKMYSKSKQFILKDTLKNYLKEVELIIK